MLIGIKRFVDKHYDKASISFIVILALYLYGCGAAKEETKGAAVPGGPDSTQGGAAAGQGTTAIQSGAPSAWGSPEADTGESLPPRAQMSEAAKQAYQRGVAASRSGDDVAAKAAFEEALSKDNRSYQAAFNLGVLADRQGKENDAEQYYRRALSIQPDYELAVQGLVNIRLRRGAVSQTIAIVEPLAQKWERNLHIQATYADVLAQGGRLDEAEQVARNALRRDERFVPAMISIIKSSLIRGRDELADSILMQAIAVDSKHPELHFIKGKMAQKAGQLADAMKSFEQAVQLRPDYTEARMALGIQYMASGNYQQALDQFLASARLAPGLVAVHLNLGDAYRALKKWTEAKREFDAALRMKNDLPEAHFNLALMYMSAGAEFPGLDMLGAYNRAISEFNNYRQLMGSKLPREDISESYIADLQRSIQREQQRIEREKAKAEREKERDARPAGSDEKEGQE
ncbi:MAG: tetratricopeptide repeat protein [Deltaproteobacteria bacterium]|nr:tetratricopeptide repeat protein [Deltaproteobacteria bacterium]